MTELKALMATSLNWHSPFRVGSHQLAAQLLREGWDVGYVSNPGSPFELVRRDPAFRGAIELHVNGGVREHDGHLWAYTPFAAITPHNVPLLRSDSVYSGWWRTTMPNVVDVAREHGFDDVDLLYFDTPVQRFWHARLRYRASVVRVSDRIRGFGAAEAALRAQERLIAAADLVVYTARPLEDEVRNAGARRSLYLPNGVDYEHFAQPRLEVPMDLASIPRPIAMYVGAIAEWFDFDTLDRMTAALPEVSFVVIGPDDRARASLQPRPNLHLLGTRPYDALPAYLQHADVGLIPFDARGHRELVDSIHPLKLYEYLASGLPVVASDWSELRSLGSPASLCGSADDHIGAVRAALATDQDRPALRAFARGADWSRRVQLLLEEAGLAATVARNEAVA
jgi:glycosyltransferase involved in cell wall biosynthesis